MSSSTAALLRHARHALLRSSARIPRVPPTPSHFPACTRPHAFPAPHAARRHCAGGGGYATTEWAEHEYVRAAHATLDAVYEGALDACAGGAFGDDWDVEAAGGIVRVDLGARGVFVANTQTPNRQIWLSSPVSGPWRFDWEVGGARWVARRDGVGLVERLEEELGGLAEGGVEVRIGRGG